MWDWVSFVAGGLISPAKMSFSSFGRHGGGREPAGSRKEDQARKKKVGHKKKRSCLPDTRNVVFLWRLMNSWPKSIHCNDDLHILR